MTRASTPGKRIRRPQVGIDTSGQLGLHDLLGAAPAVAPPPTPGTAKAVRFVRPDPRAIMLGAKRLDEHLRAMGLEWPFVAQRLLAEQDWKPFIARYSPEGRPGYAPEPMVGLVVAGIMQGIDSLRGLEELARTNLGVMWLTGGICPDHSVIGRFLLLHADTLTGEFFAGLTLSVLKATGSGLGTLAGDGTVVAAAVARVGTLRAEALAAARREAEEKAKAAPAAEEEEEKQEKQEKAKEDAAAAAEKLRIAEAELARRTAARQAKGRDAKGLSIHPDEPDAVVQPQKDKTFAPSYKPSVLCTPARVVVAGTVHPSSETVVIPELLDQAAAIGQTLGQEPGKSTQDDAQGKAVSHEIETLLLDAGYNGAGTIQTTKDRSVELLAPEGRTLDGVTDTAKQSDKKFLKSRFVYDAPSDTYLCPAGQNLHRLRSTAEYTEYGRAPCTDCPLRAKCTASRTGREVKRYPTDPDKEVMRAKLAEPEHRRRYNKRAGMVEPVFAHLKVVQGLRRFRRRGLAKVRLELMLHLAAYNLSRAVALAGALLGLIACALAALLRRRPFRHPEPTRRRRTLPWPATRVPTTASTPCFATERL